MKLYIEPYQYTLKRPVSCCGVGLHKGKKVNLAIHPAPANTGIQFLRTDLREQPVIQARVEKVVDTNLATTISDGYHAISTTEHLLAAIHGLGIDNAVIYLDSDEVPIMDGSAGPFVHLLRSAGRQRQPSLRKVLRITRPLSYTENGKSISIEPYDGFKITGRIHFDDALISEQQYSMDVTRERFSKEIATARTFGFVEQVEQLWQNGLALGGTLANVIAIHWDRRSILNEDGLRFDDEFIRHKVLDVIGDFALLGSPILGHIVANRSGHGLHRCLMEAIVNRPECWEYVTLQHDGSSFFHQVTQSAPSPGHCFAPFFAPLGKAMALNPAYA